MKLKNFFKESDLFFPTLLAGWTLSFIFIAFAFTQCKEAHADFKKGPSANALHIDLGTMPAQTIYIGTASGGKVKVWENSDPPTILTFTATPSPIDLDTRATGNVTLSWTATAQTGKAQTSQVYLEPQGTRIGQTYVTGANTGVSESFTTPQPTETKHTQHLSLIHI